MTDPIPLFVELCAGTAAVSLRLHRDGARPPVSRMGSKAGYADTILRVLGLIPGQRAAAYLWCEPDPGVRLLLEAYRDGALAKAAAAIIRSWAGEDPRALWERLRAEGPPRCPDGGVEVGEVARWLNIEAWANGGRYMGPDRPSARREVEPDRTLAITAAGLASRADTLPTLPAAIAPDARQVDPREVARHLFVVGGSMLGDGKGIYGGNLIGWTDGANGAGDKAPLSARLPKHLEALPVPLPALIHPDARTVDPGPALPPGTVAYMDPPYVGTTGYAADLPRAEVVALARRWAAAGAVVCISEAEAIPELVAEGWHAVRIDGERVGARRTFSKQQAEWLTLNRPPAWRPSVQGGLFAPR
jgi:hypothetical protein